MTTRCNETSMGRSSLRKFLSCVKPYRWMIAGATLCGLLKYNIPVVFPWILKDVIDHLLTPSPSYTTMLHITMVSLVGLYLAWAVITYLRSYFIDTVGGRVVFDLRHQLYRHLQRMSLSFYEKRQVGSLASRILWDISMAQNFVGAAFTNAVMDASVIILIAGLLSYMNWQLTLASLSILPLYVALNRFFQNKIKRTSGEAHQKLEEISGDLYERLDGISIVQSYTREKAEERHFFEENRTYLSHLMTNVKNYGLALALTGLLTSVAPVLVVWYGGIQVIHGHLTVGELVAFYAYLGMLYQPLNRLTELNVVIANSLAAMDRIFEVFDTSPEISDRPGAREIPSAKGEIRFLGVGFSYNGSSRKILDAINLHIPVGTTVALVGSSGSGKSTFIKLMLRFYELSEGSIQIDGWDIRDITLESLRRNIALVPQEPILFSGTVYDNILFGKEGASEAEVVAAAMAADAHDFIIGLVGGYHKEIGQVGSRLSGGQKQRIALARAFLKDAPILILDEATSALDSESESSIQRALKRLMRGRTTIVIAHRLSTIQSADMIVVFDAGVIAEIGNHHELLTKPHGVYQRLHMEQFGKHLTQGSRERSFSGIE